MDTALRHRVNAARVAVSNQIPFFRKFLGDVASEWKADETRVTFADFAISENLLSELRRSFPDDGFYSEESSSPAEVLPVEARYAWLLDPIDGTNNYALGIPACAISLALLKEGIPVYGWVYDASRDELLEGGRSFPIQINGHRHASSLRPFSPQTALVALHFPMPADRIHRLAPLLESTRVRSLGSAALHLAYVALGRLDGVLDEKVKVWDIAAALCLIHSAGLPVFFPDGDPFPLRSFSTASPAIRYAAGHPEFVRSSENWLG